MCDAPVKECPRWIDDHCKASHTSPFWRAERAAWRSKDAAAPAGSAGASAHVPRVERWACDKLLAAIQQVFPQEEPEPAGLAQGITLKPYQRQ